MYVYIYIRKHVLARDRCSYSFFAHDRYHLLWGQCTIATPDVTCQSAPLLLKFQTCLDCMTACLNAGTSGCQTFQFLPDMPTCSPFFSASTACKLPKLIATFIIVIIVIVIACTFINHYDQPLIAPQVLPRFQLLALRLWYTKKTFSSFFNTFSQIFVCFQVMKRRVKCFICNNLSIRLAHRSPAQGHPPRILQQPLLPVLLRLPPNFLQCLLPTLLQS